MSVPDLLRDSFFGRIVYYASARRLFRHPEERPDFKLPPRYSVHMPGAAAAPRAESPAPSNRVSQAGTLAADDRRTSKGTILDDVTVNTAEHSEAHMPHRESTVAHEVLHLHPHDAEKATIAAMEREEERVYDNPNIVDWYGPGDPECPENWSFWKKTFVTYQIAHITFAIYIGSAIFAPGIPDLAEKFGISLVAGNLGITMFVLGYAIGPMFLAPMSEIPQFGRAPVYMITLLIFSLVQIPTALAKNLGALLPLRFLAGFVGSPPLATGGASLADMWPPQDRVVVIGAWSIAAMCGPTLGPLVGGFAAQAEGWTWTIWILLWLGGASWALLFFTMPETSSQAILYRRAVRLRRLTGNPALKSQAEIESEHMTVNEIAMMTLVRPFVLGFREPIVAFWNLYLGMVYGILYCFIASFDVVFIEHHHFNLGQNGLAFLGIITGVIIAFFGFLPWALYTLKPIFARGEFVPEDRLPPAFFGAFFFPISLFWFGWTSAAGVHWIVPILASGLWAMGAFYLFQAGMNYLADCYPRYVASVLASNDLFRSFIGAAFPLFSTAYFHNLGVGPALSIIGGIAIGMLPIPFALYRYGHKIRAWSKFAD
ncbi:MFS general substrate transporter [Phanerochaete sordida]|uniref:MFS general substrate transporter n=1 Tax=Phanerochaete sordida TaxID=48140 RepID=A0A9P3LLW1_9APHY|nr:MFS general substrate transporter [Phanerochaete sordida]